MYMCIYMCSPTTGSSVKNSTSGRHGNTEDPAYD